MSPTTTTDDDCPAADLRGALPLPTYKAFVTRDKESAGGAATVLLFPHVRPPALARVADARSDLSPPDLASLRTHFGNGFFNDLALGAGFLPSGRRKRGGASYVIAPTPLFDEDRAVDVMRKLRAAMGAAAEEPLYAWAQSLRPASLDAIVDDALHGRQLLPRAELAQALADRFGATLPDAGARPREVLTRLQAASECGAVLDLASRERCTIGWRYVWDGAGRKFHATYPVVPTAVDEARLGRLYTSPNLAVEDQGERTLGSYRASDRTLHVRRFGAGGGVAAAFYAPSVLRPPTDVDAEEDLASGARKDRVVAQLLDLLGLGDGTLLPPALRVSACRLLELRVCVPAEVPSVQALDVAAEFARFEATTSAVPFARLDAPDGPARFKVARRLAAQPQRVHEIERQWVHESTAQLLHAATAGGATSIAYRVQHAPTGAGAVFVRSDAPALNGACLIRGVPRPEDARAVLTEAVLPFVGATTYAVQRWTTAFEVKVPRRCAARDVANACSQPPFSHLFSVLSEGADDVRLLYLRPLFAHHRLALSVRLAPDATSSVVLRIDARRGVALAPAELEACSAACVRALVALLGVAASVTALPTEWATTASAAFPSERADDAEAEDDDAFLRDYFKDVDVAADGTAPPPANTTPTTPAPPPTKQQQQAAATTSSGDQYLLVQLKQADPALFDYRTRAHARKKYSMHCQGSRQPVVVTPAELATYDAALRDPKRRYGTYGKAVLYGSTPELAARNAYICPPVWCPKGRLPLSLAEFEALGRRCPLADDEPMVFSDFDYWKYVDRRTGEVRHKQRFVGFNDGSGHPDGLCMPCCFSMPKDDDNQLCTAAMRVRLGLAPEEEEEGAEQAHGKVPAAAAGDGNQKYILGDVVTLLPGRFGLLPAWVDRLFGNASDTRGSRVYGAGFMTPKTRAFLRVGPAVANTQQPFLECMVQLLGNPAARSAAQLVELLVQRLTPEAFVAAADGMVMRTFASLVARGIRAVHLPSPVPALVRFLEASPEYVRSYSLQPVLQRAKALPRDSSADADGSIARELRIYSAFRAFRDYLLDPAVVKTPDVVGGVFQLTLPWLNPHRYAFCFVYADQGMVVAPPASDAQQAPASLVAFVLASMSRQVYEPISFVSLRATAGGKGKLQSVLHHERDAVARVLDAAAAAPRPQDDDPLHRTFLAIHELGEFVRHVVVSYDRAAVGLVCAHGLVVPLARPCALPPLSLGQTYVYEDDVLRLLAHEYPPGWRLPRRIAEAAVRKLGMTALPGVDGDADRVLRVAVDGRASFLVPLTAELPDELAHEVLLAGRIDNELFLQGGPPAAAAGATAVPSEDYAVLALDLAETVRRDAETLALIEALRHPLSPLPRVAKVALLCRHLRRLRAGTPEPALARFGDALIGESHLQLTRRLAASVRPTLLLELAARDGSSRETAEFDAEDIREVGARPALQRALNPYLLLAAVRPVPRAMPDVVATETSAAMLRKTQTAELPGAFRPVMHRWRARLQGFEVYEERASMPDGLTDLYRTFERVCGAVGRFTRLGWAGLRAVTTAFIMSDADLLEQAVQSNPALERYGSDRDGLRRVVSLGAYQPSLAEICVMSRLADVCTIVLMRKMNNEDDDGFLCMNNAPSSAKLYLILQHRYDRDAGGDVFLPIVRRRRDIVHDEAAFSSQMRATLAERCGCVTCWDDRCKLVVEQVVRIKEQHRATLLTSRKK